MFVPKKSRGSGSRRTRRRDPEDSKPPADSSEISTTPVTRHAGGAGGSAPRRLRASSPVAPTRTKTGLPATAAASGDYHHGTAAEEAPTRRTDPPETTLDGAMIESSLSSLRHTPRTRTTFEPSTATLAPTVSARVSSAFRTAMDAVFHRKPPFKGGAPNNIPLQTSVYATHTLPRPTAPKPEDQCSATHRSSERASLRPSAEANQGTHSRTLRVVTRKSANEQLPVQNAPVTTVMAVEIPPGARFPRVPLMLIRGPRMSAGSPEPRMPPGSAPRMLRGVEPRMLTDSSFWQRPHFPPRAPLTGAVLSAAQMERSVTIGSARRDPAQQVSPTQLSEPDALKVTSQHPPSSEMAHIAPESHTQLTMPNVLPGTSLSRPEMVDAATEVSETRLTRLDALRVKADHLSSSERMNAVPMVSEATQTMTDLPQKTFEHPPSSEMLNTGPEVCGTQPTSSNVLPNEAHQLGSVEIANVPSEEPSWGKEADKEFHSKVTSALTATAAAPSPAAPSAVACRPALAADNRHPPETPVTAHVEAAQHLSPTGASDERGPSQPSPAAPSAVACRPALAADNRHPLETPVKAHVEKDAQHLSPTGASDERGKTGMTGSEPMELSTSDAHIAPAPRTDAPAEDQTVYAEPETRPLVASYHHDKGPRSTGVLSPASPPETHPDMHGEKAPAQKLSQTGEIDERDKRRLAGTTGCDPMKVSTSDASIALAPQKEASAEVLTPSAEPETRPLVVSYHQDKGRRSTGALSPASPPEMHPAARAEAPSDKSPSSPVTPSKESDAGTNRPKTKSPSSKSATKANDTMVSSVKTAEAELADVGKIQTKSSEKSTMVGHASESKTPAKEPSVNLASKSPPPNGSSVKAVPAGPKSESKTAPKEPSVKAAGACHTSTSKTPPPKESPMKAVPAGLAAASKTPPPKEPLVKAVPAGLATASKTPAKASSVGHTNANKVHEINVSEIPGRSDKIPEKRLVTEELQSGAQKNVPEERISMPETTQQSCRTRASFASVKTYCSTDYDMTLAKTESLAPTKTSKSSEQKSVIEGEAKLAKVFLPKDVGPASTGGATPCSAPVPHAGAQKEPGPLRSERLEKDKCRKQLATEHPVDTNTVLVPNLKSAAGTQVLQQGQEGEAKLPKIFPAAAVSKGQANQTPSSPPTPGKPQSKPSEKAPPTMSVPPAHDAEPLTAPTHLSESEPTAAKSQPGLSGAGEALPHPQK
ncbi:proteoglycan 4-like [Dermacentor silvarum]|uniref:proteoglycan 4-like n=1 Tax=Dermacentor silvarum TaxID=543639 RepID=UPI0018994C6B|nr:proteoglycan 4-like [Dermacentor silvarum]